MNLVLFEPAEVGADGSVRVTGARAAHLEKVLGVSPGAVVRVGVIDGPVGAGTVTSVSDRGIELRCVFDAVPEPPRVDLLLAVPRPKVLRRLWAQVAALGVGQVILTNAEKVERDYVGSHVVREDVYRPLLVEGLQQAKDTRLPRVSIHKRFKVLVEDDLDRLCPGARRIVAHPCPHPRGTRSVASALEGIAEEERVLVAVGPEGGWNDFEIALLETHGFVNVSLGPRTLATTTACVALLALVHDALSKP